MKTGIIIQARLGSTRLPQKMMLKLNSQAIIEYLLNRLQDTAFVDEVIVATTRDEQDDRLGQFVKNLGFPVFRGSTRNVLDRFYHAAKTHRLDIIVRICGDNPFLESAEISRLISILKTQDYDYVANCLPDGTHLILTGTGMAVEVFTLNALEKIMQSNPDEYHQEHVTPYFYENPGEFNIHFSPVPFELEKEVRLTIQRIMDYLKNHPTMLRSMSEIAQQQQKGRAS